MKPVAIYLILTQLGTGEQVIHSITFLSISVESGREIQEILLMY